MKLCLVMNQAILRLEQEMKTDCDVQNFGLKNLLNAV